MINGRSPVPLSRRELLRAGGLSAGVAGLGGLGAGTAETTSPTEVAVGSGTNMAAAISPDGQLIAIDLYGILWLVPAGGGPATAITDAFADAAYPCWSPDGRRLAFQSYRSGNFHIWTIERNGGGARQLTSGFADHREPSFTPDGRAILFSSDMSGRYAIHKLDLDTGKIEQVSGGSGQDSEPCMAPDGERIAYISDGLRLMVMGAGQPGTEIVSVPSSADWTRFSQLYAPSFLPDGTLSHVSLVNGSASLRAGSRILATGDIHPFRATGTGGALIYTADGQIQRRTQAGKVTAVPFQARIAAASPSYVKARRDFTSRKPRDVVGIASPMLSPDGKQVVFGALNDIYLLSVGNPTPQRLTSGPSHKCHPAWSPDGGQIVFCDDRDGAFNLWLHDLSTNRQVKLTRLTSSAALFPCWSPDGTEIAFLNQAGALHLVAIKDGGIRQLYDPLWLPGRPSFSPDGSKLALAAFKPMSRRYREGLSEILTVDVRTAKGSYQPVGENRSIATRGDDGPSWSPDGRHFAYIFASTLWIRPVDESGKLVGVPRQLTRDVTDAPSWSGDSRRLLYLRNGRVRMVSVGSGEDVGVPLRFTWALAKSPPLSVVRGARIWDGIQPNYREGDVVLRGNRIDGIAAAGSIAPEGAQVTDGRGLTLLPGLIDMHTHRQVQGNAYGSRMGRMLLAMGITTSRSPGGAAYHMVQEREAVDSGLRVAPRHFASGEALDGSRIYYNFMRPVTEPGQLALELSRAKALAYDMVKTYVRMDNRTQADVIAAAHALGLPVSSHYHYPALRWGADAVEHLGATSRFGFSRTLTSLGNAHEDVHTLFAATGAGRVPTLFAANALLPDYPDLAGDVRAKALLPAWDYDRFQKLVKLMRDGDRKPLLASLERNVAQVRALLDRGGRILTGTDAPIDTVGISYHLNLRAMTRFGISPYQALLTGTRHAAEHLGQPLGLIAKGSLADLILVEGDPLARIEDAANVRMVIRDGVPIRLSELVGPLEQVGSPEDELASFSGQDQYWWHRPDYLDAGHADCMGGHVAAA